MGGGRRLNQYILEFHFISSIDFLFVPFFVTFLVAALEITLKKHLMIVYVQKILDYFRNYLRTL